MTDADRLRLLLTALNHFSRPLTALRLEAWRLCDDSAGYRYEARAAVVMNGMTEGNPVVGQIAVNVFSPPSRTMTPPAIETAIPLLLRKAEELRTDMLAELQGLASP